MNEGSLADQLEEAKIQVESRDMELETVRTQLAEARHSYEARISDLEAQALEGRNAVEMSLQVRPPAPSHSFFLFRFCETRKNAKEVVK